MTLRELLQTISEKYHAFTDWLAQSLHDLWNGILDSTVEFWLIVIAAMIGTYVVITTIQKSLIYLEERRERKETERRDQEEVES